MQNATRKSESAPSDPARRKPVTAAKRAKLPVLLVSGDDGLWPEIGPHVGGDLVLKQVDSIEELLTAIASGQPAIVLWDARNQSDAAGALSRLQLHSPRLAVVALDEASAAPAWTNPIALRQVVAHVALPIQAGHFTAALDSAQEEVNARMALLGDGSPAAPDTAAPASGKSAAGTPAAGSRAAPAGPRSIPWIPASIIAAVLIVCAGTFAVLRHGNPPAKPAPEANPQHAAQPSGKAAAGADEKVDLLVEKAEQAMRDRHFIDPADGSALTLYRSALLIDPGNGEARQGLQRLAEILFARVQSALDERKFDVALQSLETARSINPGDSRLSVLDDRIASLRAELGPAQILAAINAQNFDRAAQLIEEAARSKSLNSAKLAQLRDELRRRHEEFETANFVKLIDTRLQQDKLTEPRNDSAAYYLLQARAAGAGAAALQPQSQEIYRRLTQAAHAAIDQRRFADAERLLSDLHTYGVPAPTIANLQRDLGTARSAAAAPEQPQYLDLAQSRLAQGKVTEPDNDSALYYLNQLRAADPKNGALPRITAAVQGQILDQARAALDGAQPARAEALLQTAGGLGTNAELTSLNQRLAQLKQAAAAAGPPEMTEASLTRLKPIELDYPSEALRKNIEGWVELSYVVSTEGKVTAVKVLNSSPAGVFDAAATRALTRVRYKPVTQGGKPTAISTKLRIAFRVSA